MIARQPNRHWSNFSWAVHSAWQGGTVTTLALSPNFAVDRLLLAGTQAGLFGTRDGGHRWQPLNAGLADPQITTVAFVPTGTGEPRVAFAGTLNGSLYRAQITDSEPSSAWQPVTGWASYGVVSTLAFSPNYQHDHTLFAATNEGIFRSQNDGATWESSTFGLLDLDILCLLCAPDFATSELLWAGSAEGGLYRSRNGARSWRDSGVGLPDSAILALLVSPDFADDQTLHAATESDGIYRSTDGGSTWERFTAALAGTTVHAMACCAHQRQWVAATTDGIYYSSDSGIEWSLAHTAIDGTDIDGTDINGTDAVLAFTVAINGDQAVAGTFLDGIIVSADGGATWSQQNEGLVAHAAPFTQVTPTHELFALDVDGLLARYDANDNSWQSLNQHVGDAAVTAIAATSRSPESLMVATETELLFYSPATDEWRAVPAPEGAATVTIINPTPALFTDPAATDQPTTAQIFFVGDSNSQLWRAEQDSRVQWHALTPPWSDALLLQLCCSPFYLRDQLLYAVTAQMIDTAGAFALTLWQGRDAGTTWEAVADLQSDSATIAMHLPQDPVAQPILLATRNRLIKLSMKSAEGDAGEGAGQWQIDQHFLAEQLRITGIATTDHYIEDRMIYLATTEGIYGGSESGQLAEDIAWQPLWPEIGEETIVGLHFSKNGQPHAVVGLGGTIWLPKE